MAGELGSLLSQWCATRQMAEPGRESDGRAFMVFDGLYEVALSQVGPTILLEAELGPVPERRDAAEALLETLLRMQLARAAEGEQTLSLSEAGVLELSEQMEAGRLDRLRFEARLGAFVNATAAMSALMASEPAARAPMPPMATQVLFP